MMGIRDDIADAIKEVENESSSSAPATSQSQGVVPEATPSIPGGNPGLGQGDEGQKAAPKEEVSSQTSEKGTSQGQGEKARDSSGKFTRTPSTDLKAKQPANDNAPSLAANDNTLGAGKAAPEPKPPQSWKPGAREKWASLPPDVQLEVARVETETRAAMSEAKEAKRVAHQLAQTVAPYEGMIRAEGGDALGAIGNLLQTAAALRTAPPTTKAQIVANLVKTFGVPIEALDNALTGQIQQGQSQAPAPYRDPRVDQLFAHLQQAQAQQQQSVMEEAQRAVTSIQDREFFADVRQDMSEILELAARRGVHMTIEQAYERALKLHPDVSQVVAQREAAKAAEASKVSSLRARQAASSIKTQPSGVSQDGESKTLRDDIMAAMASHQH